MSVSIVLKIWDRVLFLFSWEIHAIEAVTICIIKIAALQCKSVPTGRVLHVELIAPLVTRRLRRM
jgi:hypothetical protein